MATRRMRVHKYLPTRMYGFCADDDGCQVFFYLRAFKSERYGDKFIPPILGEEVDVTYDPNGGDGEAPKADQVCRLQAPTHQTGIVSSFDQGRGYGFIEGHDGKEYYLHRSEVLDGRLPLRGQTASFVIGGSPTDRSPRACYVAIMK